MAKPSLQDLANMDSDKWYDVRTTTSRVSGSMITAKKRGTPGRYRYFLAWDRKHLMEIVHYEEMV